MREATTIELATTLTEVAVKHWQPFTASTPGGLPFEGLICLAENNWMGALAIERVDGQPTFQLERVMPHLTYPYADRERTVLLPPDFQEARFYEKLDGTNVCWYPLRSAEGSILEVVPKTRLRPVAAGSAWGDWPALLAQLGVEAAVDQAVRASGLNLCFELWGRGNPHLVEYERDLALTLHTGVAADRLATPAELDAIADAHGFERPLCLAILAGDVAAVAEGYRRLQEEAEARNLGAGQDRYLTEGAILVLSDSFGSTYFKCKPPSIEEIHWAQTGLSRPLVLQALVKVVEAGVELERGNSEPLWEVLRADWDSRALSAATELVERLYAEFVDDMERRRQVWAQLEAADLPITDTVAVMRYLSQFHPRGQMGWVYAAYRQYLARVRVPSNEV